MRTFSETAKHVNVRYDSFAAFIEHVAGMQDYRTDSMSYRKEWFGGIASMDEALQLARSGMSADGVKALAIAEDNLQEVDRELVNQQFQSFYDVSGSDVDVARYLSGEPENMIAYYMDDTQQTQRVVTLVMSTGAPGSVSGEAITKHGHAVMSLLLAIEQTGLQTELWLEHVSSESNGYTGREQILIKQAGELFDAGMFMYATTHPSMLRALLLNSMHAYPSKWQKRFKVGNGYGRATNTFVHPEDYPDGAIYIPGIMRDSDAGQCVDRTLRELGLLAN